eukprot:GHUV01018127.1.p1 GENE.GHUV01018127.1~~GHUV01018127.1.p1  ORF type:complete len:186 (+),score=30.18 GHUV01018127.1:1201-1758(+)
MAALALCIEEIMSCLTAPKSGSSAGGCGSGFCQGLTGPTSLPTQRVTGPMSRVISCNQCDNQQQHPLSAITKNKHPTDSQCYGLGNKRLTVLHHLLEEVSTPLLMQPAHPWADQTLSPLTFRHVADSSSALPSRHPTVHATRTNNPGMLLPPSGLGGGISPGVKLSGQQLLLGLSKLAHSTEETR